MVNLVIKDVEQLNWVFQILKLLHMELLVEIVVKLRNIVIVDKSQSWWFFMHNTIDRIGFNFNIECKGKHH